MNREIYSGAFFSGLLITLLCWGVLNLVSYEIAWRQDQVNPISFSGGEPIFDWGFPFYWTNAGGFFANALIVAGSSIVIGHLVNVTNTKILKGDQE
ncbi:MAG: hypothetical protein AB7V18_05775 [Pyrinomonadaceae bacterium]